ncbi:hypothetical protein [Leucobacter sp. GX24907]
MAHIQAPVKGFTGTVAGVSFTNGAGTTDDPRALAYFERQGYSITAGEGKEQAPKKPAAKKPAAKPAEAAGEGKEQG